MSEANKQLILRWFEQVWNQKNESAIDEMYSPDSKAHDFPEPGMILIGPESFKAVHRDFCKAFPDLHVTIDDLVAEGDIVASRWTVAMTHSGDFQGLAATGRRATLVGSTFSLVRNGEIIEGWNHVNVHHLMHQLQA